MQRSSGIFLPVASLPGRHPIGDMGPAAYAFVDSLARAGQHIWAILPLQIPDSVGSPYNSLSSLAGNWLLISPEQLFRDGWITRDQLPAPGDFSRVRYSQSHRLKRRLIGLAWQTFQRQGTSAQRAAWMEFQKQNRDWLEDYAAFMAIKDRHHGQPWHRWPKPLAAHQPKAIQQFRDRYAGETEYFMFGQWLFEDQWQRLRQYAHKRSVNMMGDLPFGVAHDSVDVWSRRALFHIGPQGQPRQTLGAPPDYFNPHGQDWATPAYHWPALEREKFHWWRQRVERALSLYDTLRFDHFIGFERTWELSHAHSKLRGHWVNHEGEKLLRALRQRWPKAVFVAEDLGSPSPGLTTLRERYRFLSSRVASFGLSYDRRNPHHPSRYSSRTVAYTSLHDLAPLGEWFENLSSAQRQHVMKYVGAVRRHDFHWQTISLLLKSRTRYVVINYPDLFGQGAEARLNRPGTLKGNWQWRAPQRLLPPAIQRRLGKLTRAAGRD